MPLKQAPHVVTARRQLPAGPPGRPKLLFVWAAAVALRLAILVGHTLPGRVRIAFSALSRAGAEALLITVFIARR